MLVVCQIVGLFENNNSPYPKVMRSIVSFSQSVLSPSVATCQFVIVTLSYVMLSSSPVLLIMSASLFDLKTRAIIFYIIYQGYLKETVRVNLL